VWLIYRETADRSLRDKATEYITQAFPTHRQFYPENLFVATWNEVGYYDSQNDKVNDSLCTNIKLFSLLDMLNTAMFLAG